MNGTPKEIDKLAVSIARQALGMDVTLSEKIDAFKALTSYYAVLAKSRLKTEDSEGSLTFGDLAAQLRDADHAGEPPNGRTARLPAG